MKEHLFSSKAGIKVWLILFLFIFFLWSAQGFTLPFSVKYDATNVADSKVTDTEILQQKKKKTEVKSSESFSQPSPVKTDKIAAPGDLDGDGVLDVNDLDDDNDGILDIDEGFCKMAGLQNAPTGLPVYTSSETQPATTWSSTINATGGTGTSNLRIIVDRYGRHQVRYDNKQNFYNPANQLTDSTVDQYNYTGIAISVGSGTSLQSYFSAANPGGAANEFNVGYKNWKTISISPQTGSGTGVDPWIVKIEFYADLNNDSNFDPVKDIKVTEYVSYIDNDLYYRHDYQVDVPAGSTLPVKMYDFRDAYFQEVADAGYGIYFGTNGVYTLGNNTTPVNDIAIIGITQDPTNAQSLFMGFLEIAGTPFKRWNANVFNYTGSVGPVGTRMRDNGELDNIIQNYNADIAYTIQYQDLAPGSNIRSSYTIIAPNGNVCIQHKDTDGDGIPDYQDSDSDNDGCPDAIEGADNVLLSHLTNGMISVGANGTGPLQVDSNGVPLLVKSGGAANVDGNANSQNVGTSADATQVSQICFSLSVTNDTYSTSAGTAYTTGIITVNDLLNGTQPVIGSGVGQVTLSQSGTWPSGFTLNTATGTVAVASTVIPGTYTMNYQVCVNGSVPALCKIATITIVLVTPYCYKLPATHMVNTVPSKHGITSLGRAGADNSNWPMIRQSAWTVLEAKTKGFVVNRVAFDNVYLPVGIPSTNFVEGMMVYDTTNNCLRIYTGTVWSCYVKPACPN